MWVTKPSDGETDQSFLDRAVEAIVTSVGAAFEAQNKRSFNCDLQSGKNVSVNGYKGIEFDLTTCEVPGKVRMFTRVINGQRHMYVGSAFFTQEDANVNRFLKSFVAGTSAGTKHPAKKPNL
jgi:hypothetical protein